MRINPTEAQYFEIVPPEPYKSKRIHEIFNLVKSGNSEKLEKILMDSYFRSQTFFAGYCFNSKRIA